MILAMADLSAISEFADGLLAQLQPAQRRALARVIARELRAANQQRIAGQVNPDGSSYIPRRNQSGKIRRKMFSKLRLARFLKTAAGEASATVEFSASVQRIARVHQYGLRDRVSHRPGAPEVQYAARELLGISDADFTRIRDQIIDHLT